MAGLGSKNTVSNGTLKSISTISSGPYVYFGDITNKNINTAGTFNSTPLSTGYNVHTIQTSGNYAFLICYRAASITVSALWLE